jgi:uncharacterized Zn finger protein
MGECKTITTEELLKDNERYCLSPLRAFNRCFECPEYEKRIKNEDGTIKIKVCESRRINEEYEKEKELKLTKFKEFFSKDLKEGDIIQIEGKMYEITKTQIGNSNKLRVILRLSK